MSNLDHPLKGNRSFALRQGRLTKGQARAFEHFDRYRLPPSEDSIDFDALFGRQAQRIVEIGSGMGEATALMAERFPDRDFLAVEVFPPGIGNLIGLCETKGLTNLKIAQADAVDLFQRRMPVHSLDGIHIFFPDPWPKKRHHKRRIIQPDFVTLLCKALKPHGYLHCATDWENYAEQMINVLDGCPALTRLSDEEVAKRSIRPTTKFESKGLDKGHSIVDLIYLASSK